MHKLGFPVIILVCTLLTVPAAEGRNHLFILSGQSNMGGMDPSLSFTPTVEAALGKTNVVVVKNARKGQAIRCWFKKWKPAEKVTLPESVDTRTFKPKYTDEGKYKIGELYDELMKDVNKAVTGKSFTSVTFIWMQGERDAKELHGDVYAASFRGLLDQLRHDLGRKDINFVIGRISDSTPKAAYHWPMIRKIQVELAESDLRGAWVNTDDLNDIVKKNGKPANGLHYTEEGYKTLGKRFADKAIELINQ